MYEGVLFEECTHSLVVFNFIVKNRDNKKVLSLRFAESNNSNNSLVVDVDFTAQFFRP